MKLRYPEDGLVSICRGDIEDAGNHLSGASSDTAFDIPSGFSQRDYLYGLGGKIRGFRDRLNGIGSKIQDTDRNLQEMEKELKLNAGNLTVSKVQKRDRMIV